MKFLKKEARNREAFVGEGLAPPAPARLRSNLDRHAKRVAARSAIADPRPKRKVAAGNLDRHAPACRM